MTLKVAGVLDKTIILVLPILRDQLGFDNARSNDRLSRAKARAVIGQLMARELARDGVALIAQQPCQRRQRRDQLVGVVRVAVQIPLIQSLFASEHGLPVGTGLLNSEAVQR